VARVEEELRRGTLFVLPARQEGFGIVAAEAMAAGLPVISTPSGGPEHLLRSSGGGQVVGSFDPQELAEALVGLLADARTLSAMRAAGRAYVAREHSFDRFLHDLAAAVARVDGYPSSA
jgi:phosphatidylinositol alpha-1,6-mannosyltransferase